MTTIVLNGTRVNAINKTPHALDIYDLEGADVLVTVPSSGMVRVPETIDTVSDGKGENPPCRRTRRPSWCRLG